MASLNVRILSPLANYLDERDTGATLAPRPPSLEGRTVGLLPNWRPSAVQILEAIGALVTAQCRPRAVVLEQMLREVPTRTGRIIDGMRDELEAFARKVDVAIIATGD